MTNDCPGNEVLDAGAVCRPSAGLCDLADLCDGVSALCPDARKTSASLCRPDAGLCDVPDYCDGGVSCPVDALLGSTAVCRGATGGPCDSAELCTGTDAGCPQNGFKSAGTVCKQAGVNATCDPADLCTGSGADCPTTLAAAMTSCTVDGCRSDKCDGSGACVIGANAPQNTACGGGGSRCCSGTCAAFSSLNHCGSCGTVCPATEGCCTIPGDPTYLCRSASSCGI